MKTMYKITISDSENVLFQNTLEIETCCTSHVPNEIIDVLGKRYAPCTVECRCLTEGWYAEKVYS